MNTESVLMPKELTAESGAKAVLTGEFSEEIELTCATCDFHGVQRDCEICGGEISYMQSVTISWPTIKRIYARAVETVAAPQDKR